MDSVMALGLTGTAFSHHRLGPHEDLLVILFLLAKIVPHFSSFQQAQKSHSALFILNQKVKKPFRLRLSISGDYKADCP